HSLQKLAREGATQQEYRTDKQARAKFFRSVKERGLNLRFGAAAVVTSVFFMAPLTALFLVVMYNVFTTRGLEPGRAAELTFLTGFATPIFFRTSVLNHNMFIMFAMFLSFVLLWRQQEHDEPLSLQRRLLA